MKIKILKLKRSFRHGLEEIILDYDLKVEFEKKYGENTFKDYQFLAVCCDHGYFHYHFKSTEPDNSIKKQHNS